MSTNYLQLCIGCIQLDFSVLIQKSSSVKGVCTFCALMTVVHQSADSSYRNDACVIAKLRARLWCTEKTLMYTLKLATLTLTHPLTPSFRQTLEELSF